MINIQKDINRIIEYSKSLGCSVVFMPPEQCFTLLKSSYGGIDLYWHVIILSNQLPKTKALAVLLHELGHYIDLIFQNDIEINLDAKGQFKRELSAWHIAGELLRMFFNTKYAYYFEITFNWAVNSYINGLNLSGGPINQ